MKMTTEIKWHDLPNTLPRRLPVLLALLSMALFPLRGGAAAPAPVQVPLGATISAGTCTLITDPASGKVDPITVDPEQDLVNGGIHGHKKLTLKVQGCLGVGGDTLKPVVNVTGNTLNDMTNVASASTPVLFRDGGDVNYAGFVLTQSQTEMDWNPSNFIAAGENIEFGAVGKSCNSTNQCNDVVLYVSLACGETSDCARNFTDESNTGKLLGSVTFTFAYK